MSDATRKPRRKEFGQVLEPHDAAIIFPLLQGKPYDEFKADIAENGQSETIKLLGGKILDGRNRYRACCDLGIEPRTEDVSIDDPVGYVLSRNLHRRHLTESQRAMVGARIIKLHRPAAKARQSNGQAKGGKTGGRGRKKKDDEDTDSFPANLPESYPAGRESRDDAAAATNVSPRSVQSAVSILESGVPELARMVDSGEVRVSIAAEVATLPVSEQKKIIEDGPQGVKAKATEIRNAPRPRKNYDLCTEIDKAAAWIRQRLKSCPADMKSKYLEGLGYCLGRLEMELDVERR